MSQPQITVALCTYNPRADYLERTIEGVRRQTLPQEEWEFLLIDNSSQPPLEGRVNLEGLPRARAVVEKEPGLSHARRRAFQEAKGVLIVNLDDDVVLNPDYLAQAKKIALEKPFLGVCGCQVKPEFEAPPIRPPAEYYGAERKVPQAIWSSDPEHYASNPWGLGSVLKRDVALACAEKTTKDPRFSVVGRKPGKLFACGDDDIAMTACDLGLGKGVFPELKVTHLIPKTKMTDEFQIKNAQGKGYSATMLAFLRQGLLPAPGGLLARLNRLYRLSRMSPRRRAEGRAIDEGVEEAVRDMQKWGWLRSN